MALRVNSITAQLGRLSLGISRTSIRFSHTKKENLDPKEEEKRQKELERSRFSAHHGEKIWVFTHFLQGMTVYTHNPVMKANKALRQIPFNGKKLKPSKLRKDYWRRMAMIQFPEGFGDVGRSVYQRLRECKKYHELSWGDDMFFGKDGTPLTKFERGKKINDQKANTVADMAAVLGGRGKGNKINRIVHADIDELVEVDVGDERALKVVDKGIPGLMQCEIWWENYEDRKYARRWPDNVTHYRFSDAVLQKMSVESDADRKSGIRPTAPPPGLVA
ncbi:transcriptional regulation of mitochondrial recombination-domain-containing protein [Hypoxylon crocopeplum]|nr:transcriptional regulation of mitochondrial recombination-domain-containing protein [Hypoxylon crocopeplum]